MNALTLDRGELRRVIEQSGTRRAGSAAGRVTGGQLISEEVIAEVMSKHTTCRCQDEQAMGAFGLDPIVPGVRVSELADFGSGCKTRLGYVCPALDNLRRRYGK